MKSLLIVLLVLKSGAFCLDINLAPDKCDDNQILDLTQDYTFIGCQGSFIRFNFIPNVMNDQVVDYTIKVTEGSQLDKNLISFTNQVFTQTVPLVSHYSKVKFEFKSSNNYAPFKLEYIGSPKITKRSIEGSFTNGSFKAGPFNSNTMQTVYLTSNPGLPQFLEMSNLKPNYIQTIIQTGNGRQTFLNGGLKEAESPKIRLGLRPINGSTVIKFVTYNPVKIQDDFTVNSEYYLAENQTVVTEIPELSSTEVPFEESETIDVYFLEIDENQFYNDYLPIFKSIISDDIIEDEGCVVEYQPLDGLFDCRKQCGMMNHHPSRGCGSISMRIKKDIVKCPTYSTKQFKSDLVNVIDSWSGELGDARIEIDQCVKFSGVSMILITVVIPIVILLIIVGLLLGIRFVLNKYEKIKFTLVPSKQKQPNWRNKKSKGIDNNAFFNLDDETTI